MVFRNTEMCFKDYWSREKIGANSPKCSNSANLLTLIASNLDSKTPRFISFLFTMIEADHLPDFVWLTPGCPDLLFFFIFKFLLFWFWVHFRRLDFLLSDLSPFMWSVMTLLPFVPKRNLCNGVTLWSMFDTKYPLGSFIQECCLHLSKSSRSIL